LYTVAGSSVYKFSPTGADLGVFASGLDAPQDLGFDSQGNLYVVSYNLGDQIHKFSPSGADLGTIGLGGLGLPWGLAIDSSDNLYVSDEIGNSIHKYSSTGTDLGVFASLSSPVGLAFDHDGNLLVVRNSTEIHKFSPTGADLETFASIPNGLGASGICLDDEGNVYVTTGLGHGVRKFSPAGADLGNVILTGFPNNSAAVDVIFGGAVPEPKEWASIAGLGLLGFAMVRRRFAVPVSLSRISNKS
jgi:sugar lactone lactonase YvrE